MKMEYGNLATTVHIRVFSVFWSEFMAMGSKTRVDSALLAYA